MLHDSLLTRWRDELTELRARTLRDVAPLTQLERRQTPAPRAWNVDQVLEHLVITNALYTASMSRALTSQAGRTAASTSPWKPTLAGRLLHRAVDPASTRRLRSPRRSRPGPDVRSDVLERFASGIDEMCAVIGRADGVDLNGVRFPSPLASLIKLNLGDGFAICAAHNARHVAQIERTIASVCA